MLQKAKIDQVRRGVWREYHKAVADLGPDDPVTQALWMSVRHAEAAARSVRA